MMTKETIILERMVEAVTTGQKELVDQYIGYVLEDISTSTSINLLSADLLGNEDISKEVLYEIQNKIKTIYGNLVSKSLTSKQPLLQKLKPIMERLENEIGIGSYTYIVELYKMVLLLVEDKGIQLSEIKPDDTKNQDLIKKIFYSKDYGCKYLKNAYVDYVYDAFNNFFNYYLKYEKNIIISAFIDLNDKIMKYVGYNNYEIPVKR